MNIDPLTIPDVIEKRQQRGGRTWWLPGDHSYWTPQSRWMANRMPPHSVDELTDPSRRRIVSNFRTLALSYAITATDFHSANAVNYVCTGPYQLDFLSSNTRSKVRRGMKRFNVRRCNPGEVIENGYLAAYDTKRRVGATPAGVAQHRLWIEQLDQDGYQLWGAVHESGEIAAWAAVLAVDNWAIIPVERSQDRFRRDYANNALLFGILEDLLSNGTTKSVSYGWSSLQANSRIETLHDFKLSMGFQAIPLRRVVWFRAPIGSVVRSRFARGIITTALRSRPNSYHLGKAAGLIEAAGNTK